jgi:hypothetical protein
LLLAKENPAFESTITAHVVAVIAEDFCVESFKAAC